MESIDLKISEINREFELDIQNCLNDENYNSLFLKYFSKTHGIVTNLLKLLPSLSLEEKKSIGPKLNKLQQELKDKYYLYKEKATQNKIKVDISFKVPALESGYLHPTTQTIREMNEFFRYHGFSVAEGPEIETAEYNFRKLNLPEGHPATDLQDTLFLSEPNILLRTHTSSVESRILTQYKPPLRFVTPGKVFRNETPNATNGSFFHQYQGVVVDKGINIQHLKYTLELFHKFLFGDDVVLRFRYKYYPEVSPGMGTDIQCRFCGGTGCSVCKHRGWVEVLGSGMIHYNTLKACGINPEVYSGFAFGMGLDRLVMSKFGIPDMRKLYWGNLVY